MIRITKQRLFAGVIADALKTVQANDQLTTAEQIRWVNAIAKATTRIEDSGSFMTWQPEKDSLLIWSDSNEIYEAGPTGCQCVSYATHGQPCWHRSAYGLVRNYLMECDRIEMEERRAMDSAPYLKKNPGAVRVLGGIAV